MYLAPYTSKLKEKDGNIAATERSVFAVLLQELENCVLGIIREHFSDQAVDIYALIYNDGLITSACFDELLRGAEALVFKCSGFKISLIEKSLHGMHPLSF